MGATIESADRRQQLDERSLSRAMVQGIRIVDSGYTTLNSGSVRQYVLVLNRRNNYSIRQRTVSDDSPDPNFDVVKSFKDNANEALKSWKQYKKDFDI